MDLLITLKQAFSPRDSTPTTIEKLGVDSNTKYISNVHGNGPPMKKRIVYDRMSTLPAKKSHPTALLGTGDVSPMHLGNFDEKDTSQVHTDAMSIIGHDAFYTQKDLHFCTDPDFSRSLVPEDKREDTFGLNMKMLLEQLANMNSILEEDSKFIGKVGPERKENLENSVKGLSNIISSSPNAQVDKFVSTWEFWLDFMARFPFQQSSSPPLQMDFFSKLSFYIEEDGIAESLRRYVYPILSASTLVLSSDSLKSQGLLRRSKDGGSKTKAKKGNPKQILMEISWFKAPSAHSLATEKSSLLDIYKQAALKPSKYDKIILLDIHRTFPNHPFFKANVESKSSSAPPFQEHVLLFSQMSADSPPLNDDILLSPNRQALFNLCRAYANYDPVVGYCQGISFFVSLLMMTNLPPEDTFVLIVRLFLLFNIRSLYHPTLYGLREYIPIFSHLLKNSNRKLCSHFKRIGLIPESYLSTWLLTFFSTLFPVPLCLRLLDLLLVFGFPILYKIPLALLSIHGQAIIESGNDFEQALYYLKTDINRIYEMDCLSVNKSHEFSAGSRHQQADQTLITEQDCHAIPSQLGNVTESSSMHDIHGQLGTIGPQSKKLIHEIIHFPLDMGYLKKLQSDYKTWFNQQDGRFTIV